MMLRFMCRMFIRGVYAMDEEVCCTTDHHPKNKMRNNSDVGDIQTPRDPYAHLSHHRNAVYSGQISTGPTDSNSEQLRVRTAHRAFLRDTTIRSHIVVWESIAMPIHVRRVYQARVMLSKNKPLASHPIPTQRSSSNPHSSPDSGNTVPAQFRSGSD
jgi:hypothetical protein